MHLKSLLKRISPDLLKRGLNRIGWYDNYIPSIGGVNFGDFKSVRPFSKEFGYDRGGPVDRYYIENFLSQNASLIRGRVLEIADNEYTTLFGGPEVSKSDILHFNNSNPKATLIGDLSNAPHLPSDAFDCIILTQTLQFIYHYKEALTTCFRMLKSGGCILLTVPGISSIDQGEWKESWLWSFTDNSIKKILGEIFPVGNISVETHGNVMSATAFLYGLGRREVKQEKLDVVDPHYQVIITAVAKKP